MIRLLVSKQEFESWQASVVATDRTLSSWIREICNAEVRRHPADSGAFGASERP